MSLGTHPSLLKEVWSLNTLNIPDSSERMKEPLQLSHGWRGETLDKCMILMSKEVCLLVEVIDCCWALDKWADWKSLTLNAADRLGNMLLLDDL